MLVLINPVPVCPSLNQKIPGLLPAVLCHSGLVVAPGIRLALLSQTQAEETRASVTARAPSVTQALSCGQLRSCFRGCGGGELDTEPCRDGRCVYRYFFPCFDPPSQAPVSGWVIFRGLFRTKRHMWFRLSLVQAIM